MRRPLEAALLAAVLLAPELASADGPRDATPATSEGEADRGAPRRPREPEPTAGEPEAQGAASGDSAAAPRAALPPDRTSDVRPEPSPSDAALLEGTGSSLESASATPATTRAAAGRVLVTAGDHGEAYWTTGRRVGVAMAATGFAAVVAGGMLTVRAVAAAGERDRALGGPDGLGVECPFGDPAACERAEDADRERKTTQAVGAVLLATGGGLIASGVTLFLFSPPRNQASAMRPQLAPSFTARGASLSLTASF